MAAQKGRLFILKVGNGGSPETFTEVGGFRANTIQGSEVEVDVTTKSDSGFRNLLDGVINQSHSWSGSGVITDNAQFAIVHASFRAGTHLNYKLEITGTSVAGGYYIGAFRVTSLEVSGDYDAEQQFSMTLASDGQVAWTATT